MEQVKLLYIDLFCGAGGTSTGVETAKYRDQQCAKVIACVNHDANAIASHAANHPDALHFTEDIRTLELSPLITHVDMMRKLYPDALIVLWASLECTNFSKAKGGQPRDADSRTLAEHLFRYIEALKPDYIQIENVEEFMSWGDLDENGKPISKDKGRAYMEWVGNVKSHGYNFRHHILDSADFGAYTTRKRFFGIFAKENLPTVFPQPTHTKKPSTNLFGSLLKWKPVREVLDLEDEGTSIFSKKKPIVEKSLIRIHSGLVKFVAGGKENFIMKYNSMNRNGKHCPPSIDEPCPTVACQNRLGLVKTTFLSKYYSGAPDSKNISIEYPAHTITNVDHHSIVNAEFISAYYGGTPNNRSVDQPAATITTHDRLAYIKPQFIDMQYGNGQSIGIDKPAATVTNKPKHNLITPWILDTNFGNVGSSLDEPSKVITANRKWHYLVNPQYSSAGGDVNKPCFTLIARMDKMPPSIITTSSQLSDIPAFIKITEEGIIYEIYSTDSPAMVQIKEFMALYGIIDIKMRMLKIPELKMIMGFPKDYVLIGTQADQKKFIGNAVEVTMARVLCEALARELIKLNIKPSKVAA